MLVLFIVLAAVFAVILIRRSGSKSAAAPARQDPQYSTTLRTGPNPSAPIVMCKDGTVYMNSRGEVRTIGTYKQQSDDQIWVYNTEQIDIGHTVSGHTGQYITLNSIELCRAKNRPMPKDGLWTAAEVLTAHNSYAIIDHDNYQPILWYSGDPAEAAAAFICWAYSGYGNKYSDFFHG